MKLEQVLKKAGKGVYFRRKAWRFNYYLVVEEDGLITDFDGDCPHLTADDICAEDWHCVNSIVL